MSANVSVLILAKNEEKNIADCIKSAVFAAEIIVIDDFSTDKTAEISKQLGAKVVQHALDGNWGAQQTFAIQQAAQPWIFFLDADERISQRLAAKLIAMPGLIIFGSSPCVMAAGFLIMWCGLFQPREHM